MNPMIDFPGCASDGFVDLQAFYDMTKGSSREELERLCTMPVLLLEAMTEESNGALVDTQHVADKELSYRKTLDQESPGRSNRYHGRMALLKKRRGNPFPDMISVGRAMNNDIVFILPTVSKMHGYFMADKLGWSFTDPRSANGTFLRGERLKPGVRQTLSDGDVIQLGTDLRATLVLPTTLVGKVVRGELVRPRA
jgi:hypothetical protein